MKLKEIRKVCDTIVEDINDSNSKRIWRDYTVFLRQFGMEQRRSSKRIKSINRQLGNRFIEISGGDKDLRQSIFDFNRGETIFLRINEELKEENKINTSANKSVKSKNAGTVQVAKTNSGITLYNHQEIAIQNLHSKITESQKVPFEGMLVLPTGGGKTLTAAYWLAKNYLAEGKKVLWIAHRHELLEQANNTFRHKVAFKDIFGQKESFNYRLISGIHDKPVHIKPTDDLIIASKDSLNAGYEYLHENWIKHHDEVFLIIDEAHHATAKTYRKLINNLKSQTSTFRMAGLTATPFRTAESEQGLLAKVFPDGLIYQVDLRTLINRGILSEPIFEEVKTDFDMTSVLSENELSNLQNFDITSIGKGTAKTIAENDKRNNAIVQRYLNNVEKYKQTLVFALNVDNAIALNTIFRSKGIRSDYVVSTIKDSLGNSISSKDNKAKIDKFRRGETDILINVNILTEGTDVPQVQSVFLARPTISPILMTQMIGRGLRGLKAGGTKEAYIVSFIDDWQDKVQWVNPEVLYVDEEVDFAEKSSKNNKRIVRLVSISKIEEFALLRNEAISTELKDKIKGLDFIARIPVGMYHFMILNKIKTDDNSTIENEKNCDVLIYDNLFKAYSEFIEELPHFFEEQNLSDKEFLYEEELEDLVDEIEEIYFYDCNSYPTYLEQDIRDILQYFAENGVAPKFVKLEDRDKYDIRKTAQIILDEKMSRTEESKYKAKLWESDKIEWKSFFGHDKPRFFEEIDLAINKICDPELYAAKTETPIDEKEMVKLISRSLHEISEKNPTHYSFLKNTVYENAKDKNGDYTCALSGFKSKYRFLFQIDHIVSRHNGGLTELKNLQLLSSKENALKGKD